MNSLTQATPAFQAKTAHIKPQAEGKIILVLEAYPGGPIRSVPKGLYDRLLAQIQGRIPELTVGKKYTAKQLCTSAFWDAIDESDHTIAGKCIAITVAHHEVQLRPAGKNDSNARCYERL